MLSATAIEYFGSMSPLAARVTSEEGPRLSPETGDSFNDYFRIVSGQKMVCDDSSNFRDEHSGPFNFRTKSQTNLLFEAELQRAPDLQDVDKELLISHSIVLSELKNALKSDNKAKAQHNTPDRRFSKLEEKRNLDMVKEYNEKNRVDKESKFDNDFPFDRSKEEGGFISKLIGGKKSKGGNSEEKERLVSSEKRCQIVASSDNFFKTDFRSANRESEEENGFKNNYKSVSGLEEARALLAGGGRQDSLATSTDSEFLSCEDTPVSATSPSSSTFMLPKTGYDFLDNW